MFQSIRPRRPIALVLAVLAAAALTLPSQAQRRSGSSELPPFDKVSEGYRKVISTADGTPSMYTIYRNDAENKLLAELPRNFEGRRFFIAVSIAGGSFYTGWQWNELYCYWREVNNQLVLMQPELQFRARGQAEIQSSVKRTYTDRVLLSVPIMSRGPGGGPVIDLTGLLVGQSERFALRLDPRLTTIEKCKAFPGNVEITFEGPGPGGRLTQIHYSISGIPRTDYKPREADERVGYFMTVYKDLAKDSTDGKQFVRYINRWNLKKRDTSLALSPPENPIVFYIEHTVPVKYRRYVRDGILEWNRAFEAIGIDGAMEVRQQDAKTGTYMDLDPEDVRYNFFRWITSESAFAMGPSRANPETGEIYDANIVFDDAMMRYYAIEYQRLIAELPMEDASPETQEWVSRHPHWDPMSHVPPTALVDDPSVPSGLPQGDYGVVFADDDTNPGTLLARVVQKSRRCDLAIGKAHQMNLARLALASTIDTAGYSEKELIDGLPEKFVAQVIKEIVMHEVGHTLGLRHNFKAAAWKSLDDINAQVGEPQTGSVMDYNPINIAPEGVEQGDWATPTLGPYDFWAIEYGYTTSETDLPKILARVAEGELQYATDEDTWGPDPLVRRWVLGDDLIEYGRRQVDHVHRLRSELLDRAVKDGEPWYPARSFFQMLLFQQASAVNTVSRFVGGTYLHRDRKGDPDARPPMVPVEPEKQREALEFIIANAFQDEAFGLDPELLRFLAIDTQRHWGNFSGAPEFPVHQTVMQVQRLALLGLMNPTTLRRVHDNEFLVPATEDAFTLPELLNALTGAIWTEILDGPTVENPYTLRKPMITSLRRNLQREYLTNLIDLSQASGVWGPPRPVQALAADWMITLRDRIDQTLNDEATLGSLDDYTRTHLRESRHRLDTAIKAVMTYRGN